jgi:peptidylprolyl isomerase
MVNLRFLPIFALGFLAQPTIAATHPTMAEVLAASKPSDWRPVDPDNTLYVELPAGRVIIELAPRFAPLHVGNIKRLVRARYFDDLSIIRLQDNYVAQWGIPRIGTPFRKG